MAGKENIRYYQCRTAQILINADVMELLGISIAIGMVMKQALMADKGIFISNMNDAEIFAQW
jgi:hypothetical protein